MDDSKLRPLSAACAHLETVAALLLEVDEPLTPVMVDRLRQSAELASAAVTLLIGRGGPPEPNTAAAGGPGIRRDEGFVFYGVQEAADRYPVSERRIYDAVNAGELVCSKFGRKILLRPEVLEPWLLTLERAHPKDESDEEAS